MRKSCDQLYEYADYLAQLRKDERVQRRGPTPFRGNEPVLTPMYAEISRRSPPSRPFLNLLCSLCIFPCAASCERCWTVHRCCRRILYHPPPAPSTPHRTT